MILGRGIIMKRIFLLVAFLLIYNFIFSQNFYRNVNPSFEPLGDKISAFDEDQGPNGPAVIMSPGCSGKDNNSIGIGFSYIKVDDNKIYQYPVYYSRGLTDEIDVSIGIPFIKLDYSNYGIKESGVGDIYLGFKFTPSTLKLLDISFSIGSVFPVGDKDIMEISGENGTDIMFTIPVQFKLPFALLNISVGETITNLSKEGKDYIFDFGFAISRSITTKFGLSLEAQLSHSKEQSETDINLFLGTQYFVSNSTSFNIIAGKQIDNDAIKTDLYLMSSLSVNF
jgi:hypothetical protein